jgi:hypothetical protein
MSSGMRAIKKQRAEREQREATENEPRARAYGLWREEGQGWRFAVLELPQSVVEQYAVHVSEADMFAVTSGKLQQRMVSEAHGLPDMKR